MNDGQNGQRGDKMKGSPKYYSWQFDRIIKETEELERKSLIHESVELFRMLRQEKGTHPEDPPQNH